MKRRVQNMKDKLIPVAVLTGIVLIWQCVCLLELVPGYMLPAPTEVIRAFVKDFSLLMQHTGYTVVEALTGLGVGILLGLAVAVLMDRSNFIYKGFYPILVISQTIPTIAIAPLLVLWLGYDMLPKIVLVVITSFFPITVGLLEGFKSADKDTIALMRCMGAREWDVFKYVKLPQAAGSFFSGLKISATYAMVGAVISEWLGGFYGLGVYMVRVKKSYAFDKMFAVIFLICLVSLLLMKVVDWIQRFSMPWVNKGRKMEE